MLNLPVRVFVAVSQLLLLVGCSVELKSIEANPRRFGASKCYEDKDGDGYFDENWNGFTGEAPDGCVEVDEEDEADLSTETSDMDDNADSFPGASEICDGEDNDGDGVVDEGLETFPWFHDADRDGHGDGEDRTDGCACPAGYVSSSDDCDDEDKSVNPDADEWCDGMDNNCDGQTDERLPTWYRDADGDGYGTSLDTCQVCSQPDGYVGDNKDCDDTDPGIHPKATESCDAIDNDCDGSIDEDVLLVFYEDKDAPGTQACRTARNRGLRG